MLGRSRILLILCGLVLGLIVWSLPTLAQDDSSDEPVLVLTVGSRSCILETVAVEAGEEATEVATSAAPRATYRPTLTPSAPATTTEDDADADAEATEVVGFNEGELVVLSLSDDCAELIEALEVPANGVLWISVSLQDDPDTSLPLAALADDEFPPQLDRRGRFFGCSIAAEGDQVCRVVVTIGDVSYQIDVPVTVQGAFFAATTEATAVPAAPEPTTAPSNPQPPPPEATP